MKIAQDWSEFRQPKAYPLTTGVLLAATGLAIWAGMSAWGGMGAAAGLHAGDALDTPAYFVLGLPLMALAVAMASFYIPERVWRWPLWLVGGHQAGVLLIGVGMQSGLSLILLALIIGVLLATLVALPALAGSVLARRVVERAY